MIAGRYTYLILTLYRTAQSATLNLEANLLALLQEDELKGWSFLSSRTEVTSAEYAAELGLAGRTAQRQLKRFMDLGLLTHIGRGPSSKYVVHYR